MSKVCIVAAEAVPFVKTGGLADVAGVLPFEVQRKDLAITVILPQHAALALPEGSALQHVGEYPVRLGWRQQTCRVSRLDWEGMTYYFIGNDYYFNRPQVYGETDDAERYAFFSRAVLEVLSQLGEMPDILHCHDWHTALIPVWLATEYRSRQPYAGCKTLLTLHNIKYQGLFGAELLTDMLDLPSAFAAPAEMGLYGGISFLKGGIRYADWLTTVSPTYAREIVDEPCGEGLQDILAARQAVLTPLLNGIDRQRYNPAADAALPRPFDGRSLKRRRDNKTALQAALALKPQADSLLLGYVGRLVPEKGAALLLEALPSLMAAGQQLIVLGVGDSGLATAWQLAAAAYPGQLCVKPHFDEVLARQMFGGADVLLVPSQYEPCGLVQMMAMRYGCLPLVHHVGGLKDTVIPHGQANACGFAFYDYQAAALTAAVATAASVYQTPAAWTALIKQALRQPCGWQQSAAGYRRLYRQLAAGPLTNE